MYKRQGEDPDDEMGRIVSWLPKVWNHVNRFLESHCFADVTIGAYSICIKLLFHSDMVEK